MPRQKSMATSVEERSIYGDFKTMSAAQIRETLVNEYGAVIDPKTKTVTYRDGSRSKERVQIRERLVDLDMDKRDKDNFKGWADPNDGVIDIPYEHNPTLGDTDGLYDQRPDKPKRKAFVDVAELHVDGNPTRELIQVPGRGEHWLDIPKDRQVSLEYGGISAKDDSRLDGDGQPQVLRLVPGRTSVSFKDAIRK